MKPFQKVIAAVLAVIFVVSMASCAPVTLNKEWSYKYGKTTYDIGVYIYALKSAYDQAKTYASKVKGYKEDESFLDLKITDSDGKKAVARDWILEKANETALEFVTVNKLFDKKEATYDEAAMTSAKDFVKNAWDVGLGASQGQYNPLSAAYNDYGVSYESFEKIYSLEEYGSDYLTYTPYGIKKNALFDKLYAKDGINEVTDEQLKEYFLKGYTDYSYLTVNLYETKTDKNNKTTNKAYSDKKTKEIKSVLEGYVNDINKGTSNFSKTFTKCQKKYSITDSDKQENRVDDLKTLKTNDKDIYKSITSLKNGKAVMVVKENKSTKEPKAYIIVKNDIKKDTDTYVKGQYRSNVLHNMQDDTFAALLKDEAKALKKDSKFASNDGAINSYSPDIFFSKPEETTTTASSEAA